MGMCPVITPELEARDARLSAVEKAVAQVPATFLKLATTGATSSAGPKALGGSPLAAPVDHVHDFGAALQRSRVPVAPSGAVTWTFATPFVDGAGSPVAPIIGCLVESPAGGPAFGEPQITALSSTSVTLQLRAQQSTINVTVGPLTLFAMAIPDNTFLHLSARNPSV